MDKTDNIKMITGMVETNIDDVKECIKMLGLVTNMNRNSSKLIRQRNFSNLVKKQGLEGLADYVRIDNQNKDVILLDISVGEGADIDKWINAKINYVFGFDIKQESIDKLKKRHYENKRKNQIYIESAVGDATNPSDDLKLKIKTFLTFLKPPRKFNLVSCQFAVHYFFQNTKTLEIVLQFISDNLEKGGYFFCTTIDGDKLLEEFEKNEVIDNPLFTIIKIDTKQYSIQTKDYPGVNNYLNEKSIESFVKKELFVKIADRVGLKLIKENPFHLKFKLAGKLSKASINTISQESIFNFKDLYDKTTSQDYINMTPDEMKLNKYYIAYVFQKV